MARSITGRQNAREQKCEYACDDAGQQAAPDDLLFHCLGRFLRSVAGKAEQVASVVKEFVNVRVAAEDRRRTLVQADEVDHQQSQDDGAGGPARASLGSRPRRRPRDPQTPLSDLAAAFREAVVTPLVAAHTVVDEEEAIGVVLFFRLGQARIVRTPE
jgi:hypothetical protein